MGDGWAAHREDIPMTVSEIRDYTRRLFGIHGDQAEFEAAQRAVTCERQGERDQARDWRRIQAALKEMRGPHLS
jgi:hypothetical protein